MVIIEYLSNIVEFFFFFLNYKIVMFVKLSVLLNVFIICIRIGIFMKYVNLNLC